MVALISYLWMLYIFLKSIKHLPLLPTRIMKRKKGNEPMLRKNPMWSWEKANWFHLPTRCLKLQKHFEPRLCHTSSINSTFCASEHWNKSCQQMKRIVKLRIYQNHVTENTYFKKKEEGSPLWNSKHKNTNFHADFFKSANSILQCFSIIKCQNSHSFSFDYSYFENSGFRML
jgi:hypothetical protein